VTTPIAPEVTSEPTKTDVATEVPEPTETPPPDVSFNGVSFSYAESLASHVNAEIIPAEIDEDLPSWGIYPEYTELTFVEYILAGTFHEPKIYVYQIEEFEAVNPDAAFGFARLREVLQDKPGEFEEAIPFLPIWNAAQMLRGQIAYFSFQNGSGIRFLSQYGQAAWPVNNTDLFYTYQGITEDGAYYVSAILPISHPGLPADGEELMAEADFAEFAENYPSYLEDITTQLNAELPDSFVPDLATLDAMIRSLRIEGWQ
jgi:hypothetical protein